MARSIINLIKRINEKGQVLFKKRLSVFLNYLEDGSCSPNNGFPPPLKRIPLDPREIDERWVKRIELQPVPRNCENIKNHNYALLTSYCGKNYFGSQRLALDGFPTVEDELCAALFKGGFITNVEHFTPQLLGFQRLSRTDRGVSAVRQVFSIKLRAIDEKKDFIREVNKHLPEDIRIFNIILTTRLFNPKLWCDSRTYSYMTPTFAFAPLDQIANENYRMSPIVLEELRKVLQVYIGHHCFHNFTNDIKPYESRAIRSIRDISCSDPFERENLEWVIIKIKGDSFVRHQIRRMVALSMAFSKGIVSREIFDTIFDPSHLYNLPMSPGLGLALEGPDYHNYNKKFASDDSHQPVEFNDINEDIQSFKEQFIESVIVKGEKEERETLQWLPNLFFYTYDEQSDRSRIFQGKLLLLEEEQTQEITQH